MAVDDQGRTGPAVPPVGQPGYEGQPPRGGLDLRPGRLPGGQGAPQDSSNGRLVARGVGGAHRDQGAGQVDEPLDVDMFLHPTETRPNLRRLD